MSSREGQLPADVGQALGKHTRQDPKMGIKTLMKFHERMASTLVAGVPSAQGSDVLRQPGCFSDENQAGCLAKIQDSHEEHDVVYHDTLKSGLSVGASMNNSMTNYLSVASLHSNPQQDLNDNMCPVISKDLRKYYKLNKEFSARIIVYRFVLNFYTLCPPSCPDQMIILFI